MAAWGVNGLRFLPPWAWAVPALALLALVLSGRLEGRARSFGDLVSVRPAFATCLLGASCAALVLLLPDHAHFVGDFLLRQGTVETALAPSVLYPQALPLDVLLHYKVPLFFSSLHLLDAAQYGRALGALEAFALGALAITCVRALGLRGVAACALACAIAWTGALGLLSGYSKAFSEMALLTVAVAAFGTRVAREGRGTLGLLLACALGLALHRSALAFVPPAFVALVLAARAPSARAGLKSKSALAGYALFAIALALFLPKIVETWASFDQAQHFASEDVTRAGGLLAASFQGRRLLDLLNLVLFFTPLVPLALASPKLDRGTLVILVLALTWGGLAFVLFPAQGAFRDWDVFAPSGVALATLAGTLAARGAKKGLSAVPAVCLAGALLVLLQAWDRDGAWRRTEAFMTGPPARTPVERAKTWDYLGASWHKAGRYADAARAFGRAAETSRSQRLYLQWAIAARDAQDVAQERRVLEDLLAFAPQTAIAWTQLGSLAWRQGDYATAARAAKELVRLSPNDADIRQRAEYVERYYEAVRDSALKR